MRRSATLDLMPHEKIEAALRRRLLVSPFRRRYCNFEYERSQPCGEILVTVKLAEREADEWPCEKWSFANDDNSLKDGKKTIG